MNGLHSPFAESLAFFFMVGSIFLIVSKVKSIIRKKHKKSLS